MKIVSNDFNVLSPFENGVDDEHEAFINYFLSGLFPNSHANHPKDSSDEEAIATHLKLIHHEKMLQKILQINHKKQQDEML